MKWFGTFILLLIISISSVSHAFAEVNFNWSVMNYVQPQQLTSSYSTCSVLDTPKTGVDFLYDLTAPLAIGVRYENYDFNSNNCNQSTGTSHILQNRFAALADWKFFRSGSTYFSVKGALGLIYSGNLSIKQPGQSDTEYSEGPAQSWTLALDLGFKTGFFKAGVEAGYGNFLISGMKKDSVSPTINLDLSGPYISLHAGAGF